MDPSGRGKDHAISRPKAIYYALLVVVVVILLLVGGWVANALALGIAASLIVELVWSVAKIARARHE
jgi:Mg2+/citrate symporter